MPPPFSQKQYDAQPHQAVGPDRSFQTNSAIGEQYPSDGNMQELQRLYGPNQQGGSHESLQARMQKFTETYGPQDAVVILDELITMGAQKDQGRDFQSVGPQHGERTNYGIARQNPTDGNLQGFESDYGYPPSVGANPLPSKTPFFSGSRPNFPGGSYGPPRKPSGLPKRR